MRSSLALLGAAAVAAAAFVFLSSGARADDPPAHPGGMPPPQPKVDHPLAKALLGTWNVAHKSEMGEGTGTTKFALALSDTSVFQDYEAAMGPMGMFQGHGMWKFSPDGKTLHGWWLDSMSPTASHFQGTLTNDGYDVKDEKGTRLTLAKTASGFEFKLYMSDGKQQFTDTYTRK
jgi:hypothetical protein